MSQERVPEDRVIVITGAARGLGQAYAVHLAGTGARVAILDVLPADETRDQAASQHGADRVLSQVADVTDEASMAHAVEAVMGRWGRIDALINNAGGPLVPSSAAESFTLQQWSQVLNVNLTGAWLSSRAVIPVMRAAGYGKIVNASSATVARGLPVGMAPYLAAKGGVIGLTRALAGELGADGIRVNAIAPGYTPVATKKVTHSAGQAAAMREAILSEQSLPATETPLDLCGTVAFLCSPQSDFITGQVIHVDGGWAFL